MLRQIAYHEAGHATTAAYYGLSYDQVSLRPETGLLGHVDVDIEAYLGWERNREEADRISDDVLLFRAVATLLSGTLAEERLLGPEWNGSPGGFDDYLYAKRLINTLLPRADVNSVERKLRRRAWNLVADLWSSIEEVAEALLVSHVLDENAATSLVLRRLSPAMKMRMAEHRRMSLEKLLFVYDET